ncbi:hypothetical protein BDV37DRAFT_207527 [Aspergillus pseudonomiae]|uniref:Uncharacterized protein n=1 Tax=Aspergillus pseudonomiae TaxID=1506151 RepID=A0A5N7DPR6_9EURO|nr:uncharacterized protein BDV37DRAFT_207527 [Aspergillus pseudonomiae]KAE8408013.1 hypothetical protein BDV37DRAFT_207527 [Aspergillus pseudonomiae]
MTAFVVFWELVLQARLQAAYACAPKLKWNYPRVLIKSEHQTHFYFFTFLCSFFFFRSTRNLTSIVQDRSSKALMRSLISNIVQDKLLWDRQKALLKVTTPRYHKHKILLRVQPAYYLWRRKGFQEITSLLGSFAYEPPAPPVGLLRNDAPFPERVESCRSSKQRPTQSTLENRKSLHNMVSPLLGVSRLRSSTDMMASFGKPVSNTRLPPRSLEKVVIACRSSL